MYNILCESHKFVDFAYVDFPLVLLGVMLIYYLHRSMTATNTLCLFVRNKSLEHRTCWTNTIQNIHYPYLRWKSIKLKSIVYDSNNGIGYELKFQLLCSFPDRSKG